MQEGELSMVCVGLSERDLKNFGRATGGAGQNFGGAVPPWHPLARTLPLIAVCAAAAQCEVMQIEAGPIARRTKSRAE